jgi:small subunit ribosomal protein S16
MLALRLKRIGKKHQAAFRLVVGERRSKLKGDYTEDLGWYSPVLKKAEFKADRVKYWLGVGAKPSDTVHNLLVRNKIIEAKPVANHKQPKKKEGDKAAAPAPKAA